MDRETGQPEHELSLSLLLTELRGATRRARRGERVPRERLDGWLDAVESARSAGGSAAPGLAVAARALLHATARSELDLAASRLGTSGPIARSTLTPTRVAGLRADLDALESLGGRTTGQRERLASLCRRQLDGRLIALEASPGGPGGALQELGMQAEANSRLGLTAAQDVPPGQGARILPASARAGATIWDDLVAADAAGVTGLDPLRERAAALNPAAPTLPLAGPGLASAFRTTGEGAGASHTPSGQAMSLLGARAWFGAPAWSAETPDLLATEQFAADIDARSRGLVPTVPLAGLPSGNYALLDLTLSRPTRVQLDWIAGEPDPWEDVASLAAAQAAVAGLAAAGAPVELERGWALPPESRGDAFARPAAEAILPGARGPVSLGSQPAFEKAVTLAQRPGYVQLLVRAQDMTVRSDERLMTRTTAELTLQSLLSAGTAGSCASVSIASIGDEAIARSVSSAVGEPLAGVQFSLTGPASEAGSRGDLAISEIELTLARPVAAGPTPEAETGLELFESDQRVVAARRQIVRVELDWVAGSDPWKHTESLRQTLTSVRRLGAAHGVEIEVVRGREVHPANWNRTFARAARDLSVVGPRGPISFAEIAALEQAVPLANRPGDARFLIAPTAHLAGLPTAASAEASERTPLRQIGRLAGAPGFLAGDSGSSSGIRESGTRAEFQRGGRLAWTGIATALSAAAIPSVGVPGGPSRLPSSAGGDASENALLGRGTAFQGQGQSAVGPSSPLSGGSAFRPLGLFSALLATPSSAERAESAVSVLPLGLAPTGRPLSLGGGLAADIGSALPLGVSGTGSSSVPGGNLATVWPALPPGLSGAGPASILGGDLAAGLPALSLARSAESVRLELDLPSGGDPSRWEAALAEARVAAESLAARGARVEIARGREVLAAAYSADQRLPASAFVLMGTHGAVDLSALRVLEGAVPVIQRPGLLRVIVAPPTLPGAPGALSLTVAGAAAATSFAGALAGPAASSFPSGSVERIGTPGVSGTSGAAALSDRSGSSIGSSLAALAPPIAVRAAGALLPRWSLPLASTPLTVSGGLASSGGALADAASPDSAELRRGAAGAVGSALTFGRAAWTPLTSTPLGVGPGSAYSPPARGTTMGRLLAGSPTELNLGGRAAPSAAEAGAASLGSWGAGRSVSDWAQQIGGGAMLAFSAGFPSMTSDDVTSFDPARGVLSRQPLASGISFPRTDSPAGAAVGDAGFGSQTTEAAAWLIGLAQSGAGSSGGPAGDLRLPTTPRRESLALAATERSLAEPTTTSRETRSAGVGPVPAGAAVAQQQASVDQMARQVYAIIRQRLAVERERGGVRAARAW